MKTDKFFENIEKISPYLIEMASDLKGVDITNLEQISFSVNPKNFNVLLSRQNHHNLMRSRSLEGCEGGWVYPRKGRISFLCGSLGEVKDKKGLTEALESYLGLKLSNTKYTMPKPFQ